MAQRTDPASTQSSQNPPPLEETEGDGWTFTDGRVSTEGRPSKHFRAEGVEPLNYNNPFAQEVERVWYDGKIVYALSVGEVEIPDAGSVKVAREYQPVYSVELDKNGKRKQEPKKVDGQFNIYDSVPGQDAYSPIWQFYYVEVPSDYQANSLRSAEDCENSGYPIHKSNDFEN